MYLSWLRIWRQLIQSSTIGWTHIILLNDEFQCSFRLPAFFRLSSLLLSFSFLFFYVAVKYWRYSLLIRFDIFGFGGLLLHQNGCSGWCLTNRCYSMGVSKQYHKKKVYCTQPQMNSPAKGKANKNALQKHAGKKNRGRMNERMKETNQMVWTKETVKKSKSIFFILWRIQALNVW